MSDGITDAEREGTLRIEKWKKDQITAFLSTVSTAELVDALCKREGVSMTILKEQHRGELNWVTINSNPQGFPWSARILVVKE